MKHHSAFHRIFATARWSLDAAGLAVFRLIEPYLGEEMILLGIDDTLTRKRGLKIFGVGMQHDPLLSSLPADFVSPVFEREGRCQVASQTAYAPRVGSGNVAGVV